MAFQTLDKFIIMHNGVGNSTEDVAVHLDLMIQIAGNGSQIVERPAQVFYQEAKTAVDIGDGRVRVRERSVELEIYVGRQQPFAEGARVVQVGRSSGQMIGDGPRGERKTIKVRGQIRAIGQHGCDLVRKLEKIRQRSFDFTNKFLQPLGDGR